MHDTPFTIGALSLPHRLIQGPLAGFSCAPFRRLFAHFSLPAYCVSEMVSAHDVLYKHREDGRYLYRAPDEGRLCYQISGTDPDIMAAAAARLEALGADIIDINCGCPKAKIRKKGAGSALLEQPERLEAIVKRVRAAIACPLTVKIRLQNEAADRSLTQRLVQAGVDALIVHGRRWTDDYDTPCNLDGIARIKQAVGIPVIVNGDIGDAASLNRALQDSACDAAMIARGATGKPWLYQHLLGHGQEAPTPAERIRLFFEHLHGLSELENEHLAVLQSKSLLRYYFRERCEEVWLQRLYRCTSLGELAEVLGG